MLISFVAQIIVTSVVLSVFGVVIMGPDFQKIL